MITENVSLDNPKSFPDILHDNFVDVSDVLVHVSATERFWNFITSTEAPTHLPGTPDYKNRAVSLKRKTVSDSCKNGIEMRRAFSCQFSLFPVYQNEIKLEWDQFDRLRQQLASASWNLAESWLSTSRQEAVETLVRLDEGFYSKIVYMYLTAVVSRQHQGMRNYSSPSIEGKTRETNGDSDDWWLSFVTTAGGAGHFLCYALSNLLADAAGSVLEFVTAGSDEESLFFFDSVLLRKLTHFDDIWLEPFKSQIEFVSHIPCDKLQFYGRAVHSKCNLFSILSSEFQCQATKAESTIAVVKREISGFRKQLARSEAQVAELKSQLNKTEVALTKAKGQLSTKEVNINLADANSELHSDYRQLQKKCEKAVIQAVSAESELASLRQFVTSLLAAPQDTEVTNVHQPRSVTTNRSTWKVVVVGGHERFHSKLRRELPRSVFLHPDRSDFTAETFEHADCVVFCVGYCSHKLAWKAAQQVRRLGLPSGYTNYVNVDKVLDDIREILHPRGAHSN